jgi:hypothetical protein
MARIDHWTADRESRKAKRSQAVKPESTRLAAWLKAKP